MVTKNNNTPDSLEEIINRDILPIDSKEGDGNASAPETDAVISGLFKQLQVIINPESPAQQSPADDQ